MRCLFLLVLLCLSVSCNSGRREYRQIVESWIGKTMEIPFLEAKIYGRDTVAEVIDKEFTILRYVDSTGCTECQLRLLEWNMLLEELDELPVDVGYIFVLNQQDYSQFEYFQRMNEYAHPVFYDRKGALDSINRLPKQASLRTFLLDKENKVVAIGDPSGNEAVWKLYKQIIKGDLK